MRAKFHFFVFVDTFSGVISSPTSGLVCAEHNGASVFSLVLTSEPTSYVTVGVSSGDTTEGNLGNMSAITFMTATWSTAQTVTVTGVNDDVVDGNITYSVVVDAAVSSDTNYLGVDGHDINVTTKDGKYSCLCDVIEDFV